MKKIEYKTVRYETGIGKRLTGDEFGESFMRVLSEQGQEGWELREVIHKIGWFHAILIFSRDAA